jgi:hypothetical protein
VLSNFVDVRAAADWRAEGSLAALDAYRPGAAEATSLRVANICGTGALAIPRPRAAQGTPMPGMRQASSQTPVFVEQDTHKKYQHATRVAALGGNATGSHPASWDPV